MKIEALLASLGPEYEFMVAGIDVSDTTKYEDVVVKLRKAEGPETGPGPESGQFHIHNDHGQERTRTEEMVLFSLRQGRTL
jgi:hypothetical protein